MDARASGSEEAKQEAGEASIHQESVSPIRDHQTKEEVSDFWNSEKPLKVPPSEPRIKGENKDLELVQDQSEITIESQIVVEDSASRQQPSSIIRKRASQDSTSLKKSVSIHSSADMLPQKAKGSTQRSRGKKNDDLDVQESIETSVYESATSLKTASVVSLKKKSL